MGLMMGLWMDAQTVIPRVILKGKRMDASLVGKLVCSMERMMGNMREPRTGEMLADNWAVGLVD